MEISVVCFVTWPMNESEAGVDLFLIETSLYLLERVSIEGRKTKTKVITLANQKGRRQSSKRVKARTNYT